MINRNLRQIMLIHPKLREIIKSGGFIEEKSPIGEDDNYYQKYYRYLDKHGFFTNKDISMSFFDITSSDVENFFSNVPTIAFEVTEDCNMKCKYCCYGDFYTHQKKRGNRTHQLEKAIKFLEYMFEKKAIASMKVPNRTLVIGFYGGEPLLDMDFIKSIVQHSKNLSAVHNIKLGYAITTNGTLLAKNMSFFAENKFEVLISLDGDNEASSYRVFKNDKPVYPIVYKNSMLLKQTYPGYFKKYVNFSVVLHNRNSYQDVLNYFKVEFDKEPLVSNMSNKYLAESKLEEFRKIVIPNKKRKTQKQKKLEVAISAKYSGTFIGTLVRKFSNNFYDEINELFLGRKDNSHSIRTGSCYPFQLRMYITVNGDIYTCERLSEEFILGKVSGSGVIIDFDRITQTYRQYFNKVFRVCKTCYNFQTCNQCAFLFHEKNGKLSCSDYLNLNSFNNKVIESISQLESQPNLYSSILKESKHDHQ